MTSLRRILLLSIVLAGLAPSLARAVQPDEVLPDPKLEARARAISAGLRCLVCQNQSIDDSKAELARDLRLLVRERLNLGESGRDRSPVRIAPPAVHAGGALKPSRAGSARGCVRRRYSAIGIS